MLVIPGRRGGRGGGQHNGHFEAEYWTFAKFYHICNEFVHKTAIKYDTNNAKVAEKYPSVITRQGRKINLLHVYSPAITI